MINWSILSDTITYVDGRFCSATPNLTIRPLDDKKHKRLFNNLKTDEVDLTPDIIFEEDRIRNTYLDKYDGIQAETSQVNCLMKVLT